MGVGVRVGSFPETYGMNITETVFYQSTNQVFHKSLDGSDGWQLCTMDPQDWRILARWRYQNIWKFMAACCIHQVFPVQSTPGKFDSTKPVRDHPQKRSYVFNLVLFGAMLCCVGFPTYNLSYSFITQYRLWSKRWRLGYLGHAASYLGPVSLLMLFSLMSL